MAGVGGLLPYPQPPLLGLAWACLDVDGPFGLAGPAGDGFDGLNAGLPPELHLESPGHLKKP